MLDTWGDRIMTTQVKVLSITSTKQASATSSVAQSTTLPQGMDFRHLPRLGALSFSGNIEEWPEFRRDWEARYSKLPDNVQLQYLKPALPVKDHAKITAVNTMSECWRRLKNLW